MLLYSSFEVGQFRRQDATRTRLGSPEPGVMIARGESRARRIEPRRREREGDAHGLRPLPIEDPHRVAEHGEWRLRADRQCVGGSGILGCLGVMRRADEGHEPGVVFSARQVPGRRDVERHLPRFVRLEHEMRREARKPPARVVLLRTGIDDHGVMWPLVGRQSRTEKRGISVLPHGVAQFPSPRRRPWACRPCC